MFEILRKLFFLLRDDCITHAIKKYARKKRDDESVVSAAEIFRAITDWRVVVAKVRRGKSVWRRGEDVG